MIACVSGPLTFPSVPVTGKGQVRWEGCREGYTAPNLSSLCFLRIPHQGSPDRGVMCQASRPDLQGQLTQDGFRLEISNCQVLKYRSVLRKSVCTRKICFAKRCMTSKGLGDHPWSLRWWIPTLYNRRSDFNSPFTKKFPRTQLLKFSPIFN